MDHPFRSATFGGFNRQDVLDYLESTSKTAAEQQTALQAQLEEQQASFNKVEEELEAFRQKAAQLEADLQKAVSQRDEAQRLLNLANADLTAIREQQALTTAQLATAQGEASLWQKKAEELEPDAQLYRAVKERTAGVELEAHRRAQAIQAEAQNQAQQLHQRMTAWLAKVEQEYDALRTEVETTVSHAALQLDRAGKSLDQVNALLGEQDVALKALTQSYEQITQPE